MFLALFIAGLFFGLHNGQVFADSSAEISKNFHGLFRAAATNDSRGLRKFEEALHRSQKTLAETYNLVKDDMTSVRKHWDDAIAIGQNDMTRMKRELHVTGIFNSEKALKELDAELKNLDSEEKIARLRQKVVAEKVEAFRLWNVIWEIQNQRRSESSIRWLLRARASIAFFEDKFDPVGYFADNYELRDIKQANPGKQRNDLIRVFKFDWIFRRMYEDPVVERLIQKIEESSIIQTTERFTAFIARDLDGISAAMNAVALNAGSGAHRAAYSTHVWETNEAVKLLCSLFETEDYVAGPRRPDEDMENCESLITVTSEVTPNRTST